MTTVTDFKVVKVEAVMALYNALLRPDGLAAYDVEEIAALMNWQGGVHYLRKALSSLVNERLVFSQKGNFSLTEHGILLHEQQLAKLVPAADRIVSRDDNSTAVKDIDAALAELEEGIKGSNDAFEEPVHRDVALAEVSALRRLVSAPALRLASFKERAKSTLNWIAEKGAATVITELCKHALKLILGVS
jgi:hypothetical protein